MGKMSTSASNLLSSSGVIFQVLNPSPDGLHPSPSRGAGWRGGPRPGWDTVTRRARCDPELNNRSERRAWLVGGAGPRESHWLWDSGLTPCSGLGPEDALHRDVRGTRAPNPQDRWLLSPWHSLSLGSNSGLLGSGVSAVSPSGSRQAADRPLHQDICFQRDLYSGGVGGGGPQGRVRSGG